ncbi:MAG: AIR synthase-related protein [Ottowia sp.]|nr:AIR synthase-related protein [Ottowia sp.]
MQRFALRNRVDPVLEQSLQAAFARQRQPCKLRMHRLLWLQEKTPGALSRVPDLENALHDAAVQELSRGTPALDAAHTYAEVQHRPGITDTLARRTVEALMAAAGAPRGTPWQDWDIAACSGWQLELDAAVDAATVHAVLERDLANPLLHVVHVASGAQLLAAGWFDPPAAPADDAVAPPMQLIPLDVAALEQENRARGLALSAAEIRTVIAHFSRPSEFRSRQGWAGHVTEVELECIAQTWSEHCKHKIFAADIAYSEDAGNFPPLGGQSVSSLYKTYIQQPTQDMWDCGYLVSVFSDNAGIVDLDPHINICIKAETHNSPSALVPYEGALTGVLGCNRDIMGCGLGARPVAGMDVFCLSGADLFPAASDPQRPQGLKDPAVIFRGVHRGVQDASHQGELPVVDGSVRFAAEFGGKPLVFVGSVGIMPKQVAGRRSEENVIRPGDKIVVAGGRVGRDGLHGATFSSLALQDDALPSTVQGDAVEQKRLQDFTLAARDAGLIQAVTDNGAGGLSSSVGEMAELAGGARLDLARHPAKYAGLADWEILISESQERMTYAVAPAHVDAFLALARNMDVEASVLGDFTDSGIFEVHNDGREVARLDLYFLHHGLEKMQLKAHFEGPKPHQPFYRGTPRQPADERLQSLPRVLATLMAAPNVASRRFMTQAYDVQALGATHIGPFVGSTQGTPSPAAVIDLQPHGGAAGNALVLAHGLCPQFSWHDTWLMAQKAVDAAMRGITAAGGNPGQAALLDNFCWPDPLEGPDNPDAHHKLGQLVRACAGMAAAAHTFAAPFVSGKDSMKNDFVGSTQGGQPIKISVPPTLLVTAIARNPQIAKSVSAEFKQAGDLVYAIGDLTGSLHGSTYADLFDVRTSQPEYPELARAAQRYRALHGLMQQGRIASCQRVGAGGLLAAAIQSCFGNRLGLALALDGIGWPQLFSETGCLLVASVRRQDSAALEAALAGHVHLLGHVTGGFELQASQSGATVAVDLEPVLVAWSAGMQRVYDA